MDKPPLRTADDIDLDELAALAAPWQTDLAPTAEELAALKRRYGVPETFEPLVWRCMVCRVGIDGQLVPEGPNITDGLCQQCKARIVADWGSGPEAAA